MGRAGFARSRLAPRLGERFARPRLDRSPVAPAAAGSPCALVTGAARGIGRELALQLARARPVLAVDALEADFPAPTRFLRADVATVAGRSAVLEAVRAAAGIEVCIHNAGVNRFGRFADVPLAVHRRVYEVNLLAPLLLTNSLMREGLLSRGILGFVSSLSHFVGYPGSAVYGGTKDGLAAAASGLAAAGRWTGLRVVTAFPGPTRTAQAFENSPDNRLEARRMPPEVVAMALRRAIERGGRYVIPGWKNRIAALAGLAFPRLMTRLMKRALLDRPEARHEHDADLRGGQTRP
ncbi:MAG TPA: SDR family NAD(P)-dependent oxidoreductase [Planctomycetia bacterium]|nr:SDR family NAD(P)-dependent oxidoreductase [Planctomycetia bacterium]